MRSTPGRPSGPACFIASWHSATRQAASVGSPRTPQLLRPSGCGWALPARRLPRSTACNLSNEGPSTSSAPDCSARPTGAQPTPVMSMRPEAVITRCKVISPRVGEPVLSDAMTDDDPSVSADASFSQHGRGGGGHLRQGRHRQCGLGFLQPTQQRVQHHHAANDDGVQRSRRRLGHRGPRTIRRPARSPTDRPLARQALQRLISWSARHRRLARATTGRRIGRQLRTQRHDRR